MRTRLQTLFVVFLAATGCDLLSGSRPTLTNKNSPYYDRPCPLEKYADNPTDLIADCRCGPNQAPRDGIPLCQRPYELNREGFAVGEGPSFAGVFNAEYLGGFLDESEGPSGTVYVAVGYGGSTDRSGAVLAIDVATGNRRAVSGTFLGVNGPYEVGAGPTFSTVLDVRRGPDQKLYAWVRTTPPSQQELFRVDPVTGDRTLIWKARDSRFPQCAAGVTALQINDNGFAVDAQGRFYLAHGTVSFGIGIVRLSADASSCELVAGASDTPELQKGVGPLPGSLQGFTFVNGKLIASGRSPKIFVSVDVETGNREVLYESQGLTPPERWAQWDETHKAWWFTGFESSVSIWAYDPETGATTDIFGGGVLPWMPLGCGGPVQINSLNYAPVFVRSNGNLLVGQDGFSLVEYEPKSGNSVIISL
jgi:hypothetical protein